MDSMRRIKFAKKSKQRYEGVRYFFAFVLCFFVMSLPVILFAETTLSRLDLNTAYALAIENNERTHIAAIEVAKNKLLLKKANTLMMPRLAVEGFSSKASEAIEFEARWRAIRCRLLRRFPKTS